MRILNNKADSAFTVSSYKGQNDVQNNVKSINNVNTVPITNFPNGRVTTMLHNSYANSVGPNGGANNYSRSHLNANNIKNYKIQDPGTSFFSLFLRQ